MTFVLPLLVTVVVSKHINFVPGADVEVADVLVVVPVVAVDIGVVVVVVSVVVNRSSITVDVDVYESS